MSVSNTNTFQLYTANGVQVDFPITFDYQNIDGGFNEILVFLRNNTTGAITPRTVSVHYTLTGADLTHPDNVRFDALFIPPTGETVVVMRTHDVYQPGDYITNGAFLAADHERFLDQLALRIQEVDRETDRAPKFPLGNTVSMEIPVVVSGAVIAVNDAGTGLELLDRDMFAGATGPQGPPGANGTNGTNGQGVPVGGTANQLLSKTDGTDFNTQWTSTPIVSDIQVTGTGLGNRFLGETLALASSTGLVKGGVISINADPAKFNLSAGAGEIVDLTDPDNPVVTPVSWSAYTAQTVTNLATQEVTYILINSSGAIVQQATYPTPIERRDMIFVGRLNHSNNVSISFADTFPDYKLSIVAGFFDLVDAMAPFKATGLVPSPNGANLKFNVSAGDAFFRSTGYSTNIKNPNIVPFTGQTPQAFRKVTQTTTVDLSDVTDVDPVNYDVAGTVTAVPGGAGTTTIQRIFKFRSGGVRVAYGQNTYSNLSAALVALQQDSFVPLPTNEQTSILIGFIVIQKNCTSLQDTTRCRLIVAAKFDTIGSGGGGGGSAFPDVFGSTGAPRSVVAATGITEAAGHMSTTSANQVIFVESSVAGIDDITANPQVQAGTTVGQRMTIIGTSITNVPFFETGNGLWLNGSFSASTNAKLRLIYDGTVWAEEGRTDA